MAVALGVSWALLTTGTVGCGHAAHKSSGEAPTDAEAPADDAEVRVQTDAAPVEDTGAPEQDSGTLIQEAAAPSPPGACAVGADLVYVASEERNLYAFDPAHVSFTLLGNIDCANGMYVNSMAIDRNATAWINYDDGSLWKVDTQHPACTSTNFLPNQQGVSLFGMGFAAKSDGGAEDTLFIDDLGGGGLGYIDLTSMMLMRLGPFTGGLVDHSCELTGTSTGNLFGFFEGSPLGDAGAAAVAALDPNTEGATQQWPLPSIDTGSDWAFAAWGGDFYLFTADKYDSNDPFTTVTRFRPGDGSVTVLAQDIGFRVVGAGSSTCAPVVVTQ
jgi:hypothetical protein